MVLSPPYGLSSLAPYSYQLCWDTQMCLEVHSVMPKPRLPGNVCFEHKYTFNGDFDGMFETMHPILNVSGVECT